MAACVHRLFHLRINILKITGGVFFYQNNLGQNDEIKVPFCVKNYSVLNYFDHILFYRKGSLYVCNRHLVIFGSLF